MKAVIEAFQRLDIKVPEYSVNFSNRFKSYNAQVVKRLLFWEFNLSSKWKTVDDEIVIGLLQSLIVRFYKKKRASINIDLYENFVKKIHMVTPKTLNDPELDESYNRVNDKYFYGMITRPNLRWGGKTVRTLGSYDYKSDLITVSSVFKGEAELLDYIMYHELLHKKHQWYSKNGKSYHHTAAFKKDEKAFSEEDTELKIQNFLRSINVMRKNGQLVKKGFLQRVFGV